MFAILSALLLGSSLGTTLANLIVKVTSSRLIDPTIPGMSNDLALYKTFDQVEFVLSVFFTLVVFCVNYLIEKKFKSNSKDINMSNTTKVFFLLFSLIIFIQSHFVTSSGKVILLLFGFIEILYLLSVKLSANFPKKDVILLATNGALTGFVTLLITNTLTTSIAIPMIGFTLCIYFYLMFNNRWKRYLISPLHLILALSIFAPTNVRFIALLTFLTFIAIYFVRYELHKSKIIRSFLYPAIIIVLIYYNPLYYTGNLDSVEEGFWLAWLQQLSNGKHLYKDIAAYQPPLIAWGMYAFTYITGFTVRNVRLFLHLGQIVSTIAFFFFCKNLLTKKISILASLLIFLSITYTPVRNNVEIRTGVGMLAILMWFYYMETKRKWVLVLSGLVSSLAIFTSTEVGIAVILTISATILLISKNKRSEIANYLIGVVVGSLPIVFYLAITKSLGNYFAYTLYYSSTFAKGYFNTELERAISVSHLRWHLIWQYLSSTAWLAELSRMIFLAAIIYIARTVLDKTKAPAKISKRVLNNKESFSLSIAIFGLILFRSTLGRSDYYHILFVLIPAIPLAYFLVEKINHKLAIYATTAFLMFVVFTKTVNENFLSYFFFKFTTYGNVVDEYKNYDLPKSQILVGVEVEVDTMEKVVRHIKENTNDNDKIFVFPWNPEIYFLADATNATSFDTPYSFWTPTYQNTMIEQLRNNKPKFIITNDKSRFGKLGPESLPLVNNFITNNYKSKVMFYPFDILEAIN